MAQYLTETRVKIYNLLKEKQNITISAKEIYEELDKQINLSTIYRNLDRLEKAGTIIRYVNEKNESTYQFSPKDHHCEEHLHLQCVKCGKLIHLDCHFMDEISEHINSHHGFKIQCKNSIIYGICKDCQENE